MLEYLITLAVAGLATTQICGAASVKCYKEAQRNLFEDDLIQGLVENSAQSFREDCKCISGECSNE